MSRPPLNPDSATKRLNLVITEAELSAINDWAWDNRIRSMSEAVRKLIQIGLETGRGETSSEIVVPIYHAIKTFRTAASAEGRTA